MISTPTERKPPFGATIKWPGEILMNGEVVDGDHSSFPECVNEEAYAMAMAYMNVEIDNVEHLKKGCDHAPCWFSHAENGLVVQTNGGDVPSEIRELQITEQTIGFFENSVSKEIFSACPDNYVRDFVSDLKKARTSLNHILCLDDPELIGIRLDRLKEGRRMRGSRVYNFDDPSIKYVVLASFPDPNGPYALMIPSISIESGSISDVCSHLDAECSPYSNHIEDCHGRTYVLAAYDQNYPALELVAYIGNKMFGFPSPGCFDVDWLLDLAFRYEQQRSDL